MTVDSTPSFDDDVQRTVYEFVERNGTATRSELLRAIRIDSGPAHSKPARSGTYTHEVTLSPAELDSCLADLTAAGHLIESDGTLRVSISGTPTELETESGTVTIRSAREADREGVLETMRSVARDGSYVVAADLAERLEQASALVRVTGVGDGNSGSNGTGEQSRLCFVAVLEREPDGEIDAETASEIDDTDAEDDVSESVVVGWLHLDTADFPSRSHTAEVTVGVDPEYRRLGIGSALLDHGLEWAADAGYRKVTQGVPATNEEVIAFLADNGWQREGERAERYRLDDEFVDEVLLAAWP